MENESILYVPTVITPVKLNDISYPCPVCDWEIAINTLVDEKKIHSVTCENCEHMVILKIKKLN